METPIMLYALSPCADQILQELQRLLPDHELEVENPNEDWSTEVVVGTTGRLFKKQWKMRFNHRADYYQGDGWPAQRAGMIQYFSQGSTPVARMAMIEALISQFEFALAVQLSPALVDDDQRLGLVSALAEAVQGCVFLPGVLLDPDFNRLHTVEGEHDAEAVFPTGFVFDAQASAASSAAEDPDEELDLLPPPDDDRVARRLLVLMAVTARGSMELAHNEQVDMGDEAKRLLDWVTALELEKEMEAAEIDVVHAPPGELSERQVIDSIWRGEGAAILAWALGLHDPSPYDEGTETSSLLEQLHFPQVEQAEAILRDATLVSSGELQDMQAEQLALHWRLRDFSINPKSMNFREFGKTCWFGPIELDWASFGKDNDLALKGVSISRATSDAISMTNSIAMERHLAINWLCGGNVSELYSDTDTST